MKHLASKNGRHDCKNCDCPLYRKQIVSDLLVTICSMADDLAVQHDPIDAIMIAVGAVLDAADGIPFESKATEALSERQIH